MGESRRSAFDCFHGAGCCGARRRLRRDWKDSSVSSRQTAFVGDVHGNLAALDGAIRAIADDPMIEHIVFLGDYLNKGYDSCAVLERLLHLVGSGRATVLRGNHEAEMLTALETGDLTAFLKMGGARTIRSYVGGRVGADVLADLRVHLPATHLRFLRSMEDTYETSGVIASHSPAGGTDMRFRIAAHVPVGPLPLVTSTFAHLDTDCGSPTGRLTIFCWPAKTFTQVDAHGRIVSNDKQGA
ncbi:metallophosphoesterase [Williamsia sp. CHRR-6]|uniref:metallophosphoesterase n=1 Tax=Williamsia sp. CHRR-6 TaxID=2835871 RepID=UPI001BD9F084|nr:metallophosphoesterase [Williamsia sp. CHRR-6]MBT0566732.1 metallophosphoesterase [Williamsia sp. CHRR-6]